MPRLAVVQVGYGDQYPSTLMGRVVAVTASLVAVLLLAVTVRRSSLVSRVSFLALQSRVFASA